MRTVARFIGVAAASGVAAWIAYRGGHGWWALGLASLAIVALWLAYRWAVHHLKPRAESAWEKAKPLASSGRAVSRRGDKARRQHGLASTAEIRRHGSARTVRKLAPTVRPSLTGQTRAQKATRRARHVGIELCRVGWQKVWASVEDVVLYFAGPRAGKTGWMAARVIDFPGPALVTSTRTDLWKESRTWRATRGPVWVFNAAGITNVDGEVGFDPLTGCESPDIATERANDMIPAGTGDAAKWAGFARAALASLLHAAALGGQTMDDVARWVADPDTHVQTVIGLLRRSPSTTAVEDARQFMRNNETTRSSITTNIMPALRWLQSPVARRAGGCDPDLPRFDIDTLLTAGTLYVIGRPEDHATPLMAALTGYVARGARRAAVRSEHGRLDPPLGLMLDEAAQFAPPLPQWTADMGGFGIPIVCAFQSRAQLIETWGRDGAAIVINNAGAILLGGGTKDPDDLKAWTELTGNRDERTETVNGRGEVTSASKRSVPVLPPSQLANLAPGQVVVFRRGMPPALGRTRSEWDRWHLPPHLRPSPRPTRGVEEEQTYPVPTPRWRAPSSPAALTPEEVPHAR